MTSKSAQADGSSNPGAVQWAQAGSGHFMLTLCRLAAPVAIRPPQPPQSQPYTFFMSRAPQPDGSERLYLHVGYFETLADAQRGVEALRPHYPNAFATVAPFAFASQPLVTQSTDAAPVKDESLTDTQLLKILETRGVSAAGDDVDESSRDQIELLRPDDTGTRQALQEAVVRGAPVSFAVQLLWSAHPVDLSSVPSLAAFKPYTLYATENRREGHSRHFLRLGFFADPISAKQVAVQVRSTYGSAAVVPVVEHEVTCAREASMGNSAIPYLVRQRVDRGIDFGGVAGAPTQAGPSSDAPSRAPRGAEAVEQTHKPRAKSKAWRDPDSLSESGVRHLRVEVLEHSTGRWRIVRLEDVPSNIGSN